MMYFLIFQKNRHAFPIKCGGNSRSHSVPAIFCIACGIDIPIESRDVRKRDDEEQIEPRDPFASQSELFDERERGWTRERGDCRSERRDIERPREQWVRCAVRVSVTVRLYRLARNTTPEEAHERTHTLASHTRTTHERMHAMVHGCMRVNSERERGRGCVEEEGAWPRRVKPVTGEQGRD